MGRTEDFESSLQVLRGFGTDISIEANEIKVLNVLPVHFLHFNQIFISSRTYSEPNCALFSSSSFLRK
jgi:hypothetical protein